jgi:hypothetical protein
MLICFRPFICAIALYQEHITHVLDVFVWGFISDSALGGLQSKEAKFNRLNYTFLFIELETYSFIYVFTVVKKSDFLVPFPRKCS